MAELETMITAIPSTANGSHAGTALLVAVGKIDRVEIVFGKMRQSIF